MAMTDWIKENAREIAESVPGREYLAKEYQTEFSNGTDGAQWTALKCPLCDSTRTFVVKETPGYRADWKCSSCPSNAPASGPLQGVHRNHGDLVTLVALKHDISQAQAIQRIREQCKQHGIAIDGPKKQRLKAFGLACKYFRRTLKTQTTVKAYLEGRKIDWERLQRDFEIGGNDVTIDTVQEYLTEIPGAMERLYQGGADALARRRSALAFALQPAVVAPLLGEGREFVGLQLRRCGDEDPKYINKGLEKDVKEGFLYGIHLSEGLAQAVREKGKVIVGKGIFDCWACHQQGHRNAVSALSSGISRQQFERVMKMNSAEIILGFTDDKELQVARARLGALQVTLSGCKEKEAFAEKAGIPDGVANLINTRVEIAEARQRDEGMVRIRESGRLQQEELDQGRYFAVRRSAIEANKGKRLLCIMEEACNKKTQSYEDGYVKVPNSFIGNGLHKKAGAAALELLMHLHRLKAGPNLPVSIKKDTLAKKTGLSKPAMDKRSQTLRTLGLLVVVHPGGSSPKKAWNWHPLFIPVK